MSSVSEFEPDVCCVFVSFRDGFPNKFICLFADDVSLCIFSQVVRHSFVNEVCCHVNLESFVLSL